MEISLWVGFLGITWCFYSLYHLFSRKQEDWIIVVTLLLISLELLHDMLVKSQYIFHFLFIHGMGGALNALVLCAIALWINYQSRKNKWITFIVTSLACLHGWNVLVHLWNYDAFLKIELLQQYYQHLQQYGNSSGSPDLLGGLTYVIILSTILVLFGGAKGKKCRPEFHYIHVIVVMVISLEFLSKSIQLLSPWDTDIYSGTLMILLVSPILTLGNRRNVQNDNHLFTLLHQAEIELDKTQSYLQEDYDLQTLARELNIHPKKLSQAINARGRGSFIDLVNERRVDHAKGLLQSHLSKIYTIESIGRMSGFKSRSAFYRAFKKYTGKTPTKFLELS